MIVIPISWTSFEILFTLELSMDNVHWLNTIHNFILFIHDIYLKNCSINNVSIILEICDRSSETTSWNAGRFFFFPSVFYRSITFRNFSHLTRYLCAKSGLSSSISSTFEQRSALEQWTRMFSNLCRWTFQILFLSNAYLCRRRWWQRRKTTLGYQTFTLSCI